MNRTSVLFALALTVIFTAIGCGSLRDQGSPISPTISQGKLSTSHNVTPPAQIHLWGYYDVYLDLEHKTAKPVLNRGAMFTANVVEFLNDSKNSVQLIVNSTPVGNGYIDADIDVVLTHPLPGLKQYNGYDVRGVFIGKGSESLKYDSALKYASKKSDQILANADGYTRWFNPSEFNGASPLGYVKGSLIPKGYVGTSTLNPYKYFADGLNATGDLWDWMNSNKSSNGVFTSSSSNTRNYYLHFPFPTPGVNFNYAVIASWRGELPSDQPANAPEAVACRVVNSSQISLVSPDLKEGNLKLDINLSGWGAQPSTIIIESTVLANPYKLTSEMVPYGGDTLYSTYHVDIPVSINSNSTSDEFWVIAEYDGYDYTNAYGVTNTADKSKLVSCSRYSLNVHNPDSGWATSWVGKYQGNEFGNDIALDSHGNVVMTGSYNNGTIVVKFDPFGNEIWEKDFENDQGMGIGVDSADNIYICTGYWGAMYVLKLDPDGTVLWCVDDDIYYSRALAVDASANVYVVGYNGQVRSYDTSGKFRWTAGFNGGDGIGQLHSVACDGGRVYASGRYRYTIDVGDGSPITSKGDYDCVLLTYDTSGKLLWKKSLGGVNWDESRAVGAKNGKVYLTTAFSSPSIDPGNGSKVKTRGMLDICLSAFDSTGKYLWSRTFGGNGDDRAYGCSIGGTGNVSISGSFDGNNFNPGDGSSINSKGYSDTYVCTYSSAGSFLWAHTWGSANNNDEIGHGVVADAIGNVFTTGYVFGTVDFAPSGSPCFEQPDIHTGSGAFIVKNLPDGCW
jgi:hypothetical protein